MEPLRGAIAWGRRSLFARKESFPHPKAIARVGCPGGRFSFDASPVVKTAVSDSADDIKRGDEVRQGGWRRGCV